MKQTPLIVLTGGGTAGHVMPCLALVPYLQDEGFDIYYIGSKGIEKKLIQDHGIKFKTISSGKLRRYFSFRNFLDIFNVIIGFLQSFIILVFNRPDVIFSKGGFVSVPVAVSGWLLRIPVVTHESDLTPGLANRIIGRFAHKILYSFKETSKYLPSDKSEYVGVPIRKELLNGDITLGKKLCGFKSDFPVILFMGGSLGAQKINEALKGAIDYLTTKYNIIHITGSGKKINFSHENYKSFEFLKDELKDIFALSNFIVSRSGANSIFEFLALQKPMLLIPLEQGSRGDQVHNANNFKSHGWAHILKESDLTPDTLITALEALISQKHEIKAPPPIAAAEKIISIIKFVGTHA